MTDRVYLGDPFIIPYDGAYYLIGTTDEQEGFRVYKSFDLERWEKGDFILNKNDTGFGDNLFWAPEMFRNNDKFYLTYSALNRKTGTLQMAIAVSDKPDGKFFNLKAPLFTTEDKGTIDGHIFKDKDGSLYLYFSQNWSENGIANGENYMAALKEDLTGLNSDIYFVSNAEMPWETVFANNRCNEGATVFCVDDIYYMTYSANDTFSDKYGIGYLTADKPLGPWIKKSTEPLFTTGNGILSPGHNSVFRDFKGNLKIVYHVLEKAGSFKRYMQISDLIAEKGTLKIIL
ncbi:MAG: family 43 glycosylhydrolase [Clostridia bacterium]|nr:family 43 glycosylhydrolase [Clostridia bacterium]